MFTTTKSITTVVMLFLINDGELVHIIVDKKLESASRQRIEFFIDSHSLIFYCVKIGRKAMVNYHCLFYAFLMSVNINILLVPYVETTNISTTR